MTDNCARNACDGEAAVSGEAETAPWRGRLAAALLGATLVLLALTAVPPWPPAGPLGHAAQLPTWLGLTTVAVAVAVATRTERGRRPILLGAAAVLTLAAVAAVALPEGGGTSGTAWAGALSCAVGAALCGALAFTGTSRAPGGTGNGTAGLRTRAGRPLLVFVGLGALLGTGLSAGAVGGGDRLAEALREDPVAEPAVRATVETLGDEPVRKEERRSLRTAQPATKTAVDAGDIAWRRTLDGPAELSTCRAAFTDEEEQDPRFTMHSTLVTLAASDEHDSPAVVGLDPATGEEQWHYSLDADEEGRVGQVAVSESCDVLVVVDPGHVVSLSAVTGHVREVTELPSPLLSLSEVSETDAEELDTAAELEEAAEWDLWWRFAPSDAHPEGEPPPLVRLRHAEQAILTTGFQQLLIRRLDAEILSRSTLGNGASPCDVLADYDVHTAVLIAGCSRPTLLRIPDQDGEDAPRPSPVTDLHHMRGVQQVPVPDLGCLTEPEIWWEDLDFRSLRAFESSSDRADVVGTCRWEDILEDGDERLEEDEVLRLATVEYDEPVGPAEEVRDLPDHGSAYPTLLGSIHNAFHSGYFTVRDGSAHLSFFNAHSLEHTVDAPEGEDFVAGDVLPIRDGQILPVYAVTDTGTTVMYEYHWDEEREFTHTVRGRTLVGQGECDGTRSVRADPSGDTVLTLCTTDSGPYGQQTEVTALREGEDFIPAG